MADDTPTLALKAAGWGFLSAISLVIGATIGVVRNPSKNVRAMLMAYGSGALIEALSIELFAHIVHLSEQGAGSASSGSSGSSAGSSGSHSGPGKSLVYVAIGMGLVGAMIFAGLNKVLNDAGGFARHASSLKGQIAKKRLMFYARLAAKLKLVPLFGECLSPLELRELASKMRKDFFEEGETIFHHEELHSPIYFLLSGEVQLEIMADGPAARCPSPAPIPEEPHHSEGSHPNKTMDDLAVEEMDSTDKDAYRQLTPEKQVTIEGGHLTPEKQVTIESQWEKTVEKKPSVTAKQPTHLSIDTQSTVMPMVLMSSPHSAQSSEQYREGSKRSYGSLEAMRGSMEAVRSETTQVADSYLVKQHQLFGEMVIISGQPLKVRAIAATDSKALKLLTHDFVDLVEENDKIRFYLAELAAKSMKLTHLFSSSCDASMEQVASVMQEVFLTRGEQIYQVVDASTPVYYLILGHVELSYPARDGSPPKECIVYPGSLFAMDHLVNQKDTKVHAVAIDRALAFRIDRSSIDKFCADYPKLKRSLTQARLQAEQMAKELSSKSGLSSGLIDPTAVQYLSETSILSQNLEEMGRTPSGNGNAPAQRLGWQETSANHGQSGDELIVQSCDDSLELALPGAVACSSPKSGPSAPSVPTTVAFSSVLPTSSSLSKRSSSRSSSLIQRTSVRSSSRSGSLSLTQIRGSLDSEAGTKPSRGERRSTTISLPSGPEAMGLAPEVSDAEILQHTPARDTVHVGDGKDHGEVHGHENVHAALMIWLGILIDAVPESIVLGILASTASSGSLMTFVIGVFLANLPEAMSSSSTMAACGIPRRRIMTMWSSIVLLTAIGAAAGAIMFPPGSENEDSSQYAIAAIEGMCGGAMLAMIANTALPEAFEQGGDVVGLSTVCGFLSALFVSIVAS